jgi:hypothetical protein
MVELGKLELRYIQHREGKASAFGSRPSGGHTRCWEKKSGESWGENDVGELLDGVGVYEQGTLPHRESPCVLSFMASSIPGFRGCLMRHHGSRGISRQAVPT